MIAHRAQARAARDTATTAGALTFTGTRCRAAGHDGTRYTSTGACVACLATRYDATRTASKPTRRRGAAAAALEPAKQLAVACIL